MVRDRPGHWMGGAQLGTQAMVPALVATPPTRPTRGGGQASRGHPRGGGLARCYVFPCRTKAVASDAIITCIVPVCHRGISVLFDSGSTFSYLSSYFTSYLDMSRDSLDTLVYVSIPVGDFIMVDRVYYFCLVTIGGYETRVDLLLLNMEDFDVILGMNWLSLYHVILDCPTKNVTLSVPWLSRFEWKGSLGHIPSRVVSFLKACWMVEKRFLAYLAFVRVMSADIPTVDLVPVVR
ncbi:uncharacterized protein [Nicotiana tomentosiformis]|uniref:uncharacterized protein n=1 Tax=Nicotiana tomentosiformis TaxID=4098 RepID=UPI00388C6EA2